MSTSTSTTDEMAIKPLSEALATPDIHLILPEAKRTHDALRTRTTTSPRLTRWRPNLQSFYQQQFHTATAHLDTEHKLHLLTICFAYKTRAAVLQFLSRVDAGVFPWATPLRQLVETAGRDSCFFPAVEGSGVVPAVEDVFVIATLGIAFPKLFFVAWASHVPLLRLTSGELLGHAAACGLGLSWEVKGGVRDRMEGEMACGKGEEEEKGWETFFAALCVGRTELAWWKREKGREGYSMEEVEGWVKRWRSVRQGDGEMDGSMIWKRAAKVLEDGAGPVKRVRWADEDGLRVSR